MAKPYNPADVEAKTYRRWERAKAFAPAADKLPTSLKLRGARRGKKPFSAVIPPPNITGSLHMGHALNSTMQDALVRYHRMNGDDTVWVPGMDHAGIATQNVVERELKKEGKTRHDLGREKFVERVWAWREKYGGVIAEQLRQLGCSLDWSRERFTLDAGYMRAVQEAFLHYARKELIYRGERIINWCPRCASSVSDLEVKYEEREGTLWYVRYPIALQGAEPTLQHSLVVATTRPETMLGDTAVAGHPADSRYKELVGKEVEVPLTGRRVPIIADRAVDREFGTGVVKVTPAHDHADADIGERHRLPIRNVIGEDGRLTDAAPSAYRGLTVAEAREKILTDLKKQNLLEKEETIRHRVGLCDRCGTVIQPLVSQQWFVKMTPLAKPAIEVLEKGLIAFHPSRWQKATLDWLRNVRDWCISRQLWWGHRLPVWYCQAEKGVGGRGSGVGETRFLHPTPHTRHPEGHVVFSITKPKKCPDCERTEFVQDPDVLDTWFSSALWPFAVFGWPEATADLRRFYPTSVLATDKGILNLWIARMIFSGLEFMNPAKFLPAKVFGSRASAKHIPFQDVLIHPTVLNLKGQRMSKSLGTGVDPIELIKEFGADATRFGLLLQSQDDQQALRFDPNAVRTGRNFVNKLWNIARYVQGVGSRGSGVGKRRRSTPNTPHPTPFDRWISHRLAETRDAVTEALETFRFGDAMRTLHDFVWDDLADWYVEVSKVPGVATPRVLRDVLRDTVRLLHPFLPFVTEELWKAFGGDGMLITAPWPAAARSSGTSAAAAGVDVRRVQHVVRDIRSARTLLGIPSARKLRVRIGARGAPLALFPAVEFLAGCTIDAGRGDGWVQVLPSGTGVAFHHGDLTGVDLPARQAEAERRVARVRARIAELERRLEAMRDGAPAAVITDAERVLAEFRAELTEQERSLTALQALSLRP